MLDTLYILGTQVCKSCSQELPLDTIHFGTRSDYANGFFSKCRRCESNRDSTTAIKLQDFKDKNLWTCTSCDTTLEINKDNFYKRIDSVTGFQYRCKTCLQGDLTRKTRLIKKDDLFLYLKDRYFGCKSRSRVKNIEFTITLELLMELWNNQSGLCAITGLQMTHTILQGKLKTNASIDRIDSTKGYILSNIQIVCNTANMMKAQLSTEELIHFCKLIIKHYE